ncbi:MAG: diacylglycerol kinase [Sulfuricurvum sp. RIFOXYD2_FULL_44_160]|uniref:Diacylglycerol kinase n=1 Tax=Sulfuricurvum kujiense TaxID=148813 RepID=A0A2D3WQD9_9BACT|nr:MULTISPECIES: diacylglycerol kinase [Sulfuricurvum]OHD96149.1 MAG: diacylglycerol kinase [Sulfuricurvum sp. RIFOXYD2_FULL_44_160]DAB39479.1 MAG TPA: diacylglycerol kinase [Sulfuricurvum kujiense]
MALNKPRYTLFKNTTYALNGLVEITKNEKSFRLQIVLFVAGIIVACSLPIDFVSKAILAVSLFIPLVAEVINSAIERTVDLVTFEHHELAKRAKDAGAALVFLSLSMLAVIWGVTLYRAFYL